MKCNTSTELCRALTERRRPPLRSSRSECIEIMFARLFHASGSAQHDHRLCPDEVTRQKAGAARYFCRCYICKIQKVVNFDDAPTTRAETKRYKIRRRRRKYYSRSNAILNARRGVVSALHGVANVRCYIFRPFIRTYTVRCCNQ